MNTTGNAASAKSANQHTTTRSPSPYDGLPYEDEDGYERRWGGLSKVATDAKSHADPLTFIADHLPHGDRTEGSVVVLLDPAGQGQPLVNVISNSPRNPTAQDCYRLLWPFAQTLGRLCPSGSGATIGLIHHRTGPAVTGPLDRRWWLAVQQAAEEHGLEVLGVMARTASGALLPITDEGTS